MAQVKQGELVQSGGRGEGRGRNGAMFGNLAPRATTRLITRGALRVEDVIDVIVAMEQ